jgi:hypothetical protein
MGAHSFYGSSDDVRRYETILKLHGNNMKRYWETTWKLWRAHVRVRMRVRVRVRLHARVRVCVRARARLHARVRVRRYFETRFSLHGTTA